jgi:hypothetical protein
MASLAARRRRCWPTRRGHRRRAGGPSRWTGRGSGASSAPCPGVARRSAGPPAASGPGRVPRLAGPGDDHRDRRTIGIEVRHVHLFQRISLRCRRALRPRGVCRARDLPCGWRNTEPVILDHGDGVLTLYARLQSVAARGAPQPGWPGAAGWRPGQDEPGSTSGPRPPEGQRPRCLAEVSRGLDSSEFDSRVRVLTSKR